MIVAMATTASRSVTVVSQHIRQGRRLEYITIAWNLLEAVVSLAAGFMAGSISLVGFGVDSVIETASGTVLLWRLRDGERGLRREAIALRLIGVCFLALACYVVIDSGKALLLRGAPETSRIGIVIAGMSLIVMPVLARAKRRVAAALSSTALEADSRQTDLCAYLSAILLVGLAANAALGWWWADPVAGLAMTPIIAREGVRALRGRQCLDCHCGTTAESSSSLGPSPHSLST
jgi:divalent metal cation (Fe/Co/Zn/Cd) transporter